MVLAQDTMVAETLGQVPEVVLDPAAEQLISALHLEIGQKDYLAVLLLQLAAAVEACIVAAAMAVP